MGTQGGASARWSDQSHLAQSPPVPHAQRLSPDPRPLSGRRGRLLGEGVIVQALSSQQGLLHGPREHAPASGTRPGQRWSIRGGRKSRPARPGPAPQPRLAMGRPCRAAPANGAAARPRMVGCRSGRARPPPALGRRSAAESRTRAGEGALAEPSRAQPSGASSSAEETETQRGVAARQGHTANARLALTALHSTCHTRRSVASVPGFLPIG